MHLNKIDFKDISFVVQGPVAGLPTDSYENRHTLRCLESIRKVFQGATIILSTWQTSNVEGLDYDVLIKSEDPGVFMLGDFTPNGARQIVSSLNGLKQVTTKYAVKTRPDLIFKNDQMLRYFERYSTLPCDPQYKLLKQRVLTLSTINPRRRTKFPFTLSDWFFFGLTEDVRNIFEIPLIKTPLVKKDRNGIDRVLDTPLSGEQYIWFTFLSKYRQIPFVDMGDISHDNITTAERYFANNCILLPARKAGIDWLRFSHAGYAQIPALSNNGLYTFTEYKRLLNQYANNQLKVIPNPFEKFTYVVVYNLRFYIEKKNPKLWAVIRRLANPRTHKKLNALKEARKTLHS